MALPKIKLGRDPAFENFLGAAVGDDEKGASVTVLSMLARLGVDPWEEASDLDGMQEAPARQRLLALMARFKDVKIELPDRSRIATQLLSFLPGQLDASGSPRVVAPVPPELQPIGAPVYWVLAVIILVGWVAMLAQGS